MTVLASPASVAPHWAAGLLEAAKGFVLRIKKVAVEITTEETLPNDNSKTTPKQENCDETLPPKQKKYINEISFHSSINYNYGLHNCLDVKKNPHITKSHRRKPAHPIAGYLNHPLQIATSSSSAFITYHSPLLSPLSPPSRLNPPASSSRGSLPHQSKCLRRLLIQQCSRDLAFLNNVALSIFGPLLVKPGRLVCLSTKQLQVIQRQLQHTREEGRRHKTINPFGIAVMCADASTTFQNRCAHDLFTADAEKKELMHCQRFEDEDGLEANIKDANTFMANLNRDRSSSSAFPRRGSSVCTKNSMTDVENCLVIARPSHSPQFAEGDLQSSHGGNTLDGNYIGVGCFCYQCSCHGAKGRNESQKTNQHTEDEAACNAIDEGSQEFTSVSSSFEGAVASTNFINECVASKEAAVQLHFLPESLIDVQAQKRKEKLKLCQLLSAEQGQLATVTCKSLHANIASEMFGNGEINYNTAQNIESYFNSMHICSENETFTNIFTILGNLMHKEGCSGCTKGIESGLISALNLNNALFPDMLSLSHTTGTPPHTTCSLPCTTGTLVPTSGVLPATTGAHPHNPGALPHTSGVLLHNTGALSHTHGILSHISGALSHTPGALSHTPGALFYTPGALSHTPDTLSHTPGALSHTPGALFHTPGALFHTAGALSNTPGALSHTPGALSYTPGALSHTPGALSHTPGDLPHTPKTLPHTPKALPHTTGTFPHTTGTFLHTTGTLPHTTGALLPTTGALLPTTGALLPTTGALLPTTGALLPTTGALLPTTGALPHVTGALPQVIGAFPCSTGTLSVAIGSLSPTTAALPPTTAALPPTTAALPPTTAALPSTTGSPLHTTKAPLPTTEAPLLTTKAPLPTTEAILHTTEAPLPTTDAPLPTTDAPLPTTDAPLPTTNTPLSTTNAPLSTTNAPLATTNAPLCTTNAPLCTTNAPLCTTNAPLSTTNAPLSTTNAPLSTTNAPLSTTNAPLSTTNAPLSTTNAPLSTTNAPLSTTNAPLSTTNAPLSTTNAPLSTTNAPLSTTNAPLSTTNAPLSTTNAPLSTTNAPLSTTNAPLSTTNAPLSTTNAPLSTTNAPLPTTEAPLLSTQAPLPTSKAPLLFHSPMTVCVELKPKQGFLEPIEGGSMQLCRFCLKQYLKCDSGAVSQRSRYCPLELFSGDERRMSCAVRELFAAPQNNLRIFADGILVENVLKYTHLCEVIPKVLLYRPYDDHSHASGAEVNHSSMATTLSPGDQDGGHLNTLTSQDLCQPDTLQHCDLNNRGFPILKFDETNFCGWDGRCNNWSEISCSTNGGLSDRACDVTSINVCGESSNSNRDIDSGNNSDCDVDETFDLTLVTDDIDIVVQPKGSCSSVVSQEVAASVVGAATLPSKLSSDSLYSSCSESSILESTPCTTDFSVMGKEVWSDRTKSWDEVASPLDDEGLIEVVRRQRALSQDAYHHPLCRTLNDKLDHLPQSSHTALNVGQLTRPHNKSSLESCSDRCPWGFSCGKSCSTLRTISDGVPTPLQNTHSNPITDNGFLCSASTSIPALIPCPSAQKSPGGAAYTSLNPNSILGKVLSSQQSRLSVVEAWEAYRRLVTLVGQATADDFLNAGPGVQIVEEEGCVGVLQCLRDWGWTGEYQDEVSLRASLLSNTKMGFGDPSTDTPMSQGGQLLALNSLRNSQDSLSHGNLELHCQQPLSPSNNQRVSLNAPQRCSSCGYDQGDCQILPASLSEGSDVLPQGNSGQTPESRNLNCDYCEQMLYVKGVGSCVLGNSLDIAKDISLCNDRESLDCMESSSPHCSTNSSTGDNDVTAELATKCLAMKPSPVSVITCFEKDQRYQCVNSQLGDKSLSLCDSTSNCERNGPSLCHEDVQSLVACALTMGYDTGASANKSIRSEEVRDGGCQKTRGGAVESLVLELQEFLQGLTFKDCSLMLLLSGPHPCTFHVQGSSGGGSEVKETGLSPTCTSTTTDTSQNNSAYASKLAQVSSNLDHSSVFSYWEKSSTDLPTKESVSLSRSPSPSSPFWVETVMGWFLCQVTVIDLVSKSPSKVSHHEEGVRKLARLVRVKLDAGDLLPTCCRVVAPGDGDT